jgi:uncharacterized Zn-finger protein
MKIVSAIVAGILGLLGLVFIIGNQGQVARIILGAVLLVAAGVLIYMVQMRPQGIDTRNVQQIDLSGDVGLERLKCQNCDAPLDKESLEVKAGAIFVHCPYCGTSYQIEEAPKW